MHQPDTFPRTLGLPAVLFLTLSVATPASSVFVIIPGMLQIAGTGALWAMLIAGVVCVATAFIYAELSSAWPVAGGEYVAVARTLGPMAGFVMLGVNVFNNLLFPPVAGLGLAAVLGLVWPGLPTVPLAIGVVGAATLVGVLRIRVGAWLTGLFLVVEVAALAVVVALGWAEPLRPILPMLAAPQMPVGQTLVPTSAASIGLAASIGIFALNGYGVAVYFGEEMQEAPRRIAAAVLWALGATLVLEGAPLVALLVAVPDLPSALVSDDPFGGLVRQFGGGRMAGAVALGVGVAIVNAVIACILACARFFWGTARDGSWRGPVDRWLAHVHPRFGSPWVATLAAGAIGMLCCLLPLPLLLVLSGTGLVAIYAGIALATIAGRRSGATSHAGYRMPLYPLAPIVTLVALGYVVATSWFDVDEGRPALLVTVAQIVGAATYYRQVLAPRGWSAGASV